MSKKDQTEISWEYLKRNGAEHYKAGLTEPIDLFKSGGILQPFAIGNIIKYAFRQREAISISDCNKIIHYAEMLKLLAREAENEA
jgi:hypothetical protein